MTIKLADGTFKTLYNILSDVHVILGTFIYNIDLVAMDINEDDIYPIIFVGRFVNTTCAKID